MLVTAVSRKAFEQSLNMVRRGGTIAFNGLPPGEFPVSIFDVVLKGISLRGSIVGTRTDLREAIAFAGAGKVRAKVRVEPVEKINEVFAEMKAGKIEGRVVLKI